VADASAGGKFCAALDGIVLTTRRRCTVGGVRFAVAAATTATATAAA
jgi:hypothetical protein